MNICCLFFGYNYFKLVNSINTSVMKDTWKMIGWDFESIFFYIEDVPKLRGGNSTEGFMVKNKSIGPNLP